MSGGGEESDGFERRAVTIKRKNGKFLDPSEYKVVQKRKRNYAGKPQVESEKRNTRRQKLYQRRLDKYGDKVDDIVEKNVNDIAMRIRKSAEEEQRKVDERVENFTLPPIVLRIEDTTKRALTERLYKFNAGMQVRTLAQALVDSGAMVNPGAKNQSSKDAQFSNAFKALQTILRFKEVYDKVQRGEKYALGGKASSQQIAERQTLSKDSFNFLFDTDENGQKIQKANPKCLELLQGGKSGASVSVRSAWVNAISTIIGRLSGFKAIYPAYSSINKSVKDDQLKDKNVLSEKEQVQWKPWTTIIECTQAELRRKVKVVDKLDFLFWALNVLQPPRRVLDWTALKYNTSSTIEKLANRSSKFNYIHYDTGSDKLTLVVNRYKTEYLGVWLSHVPETSLLYHAFKNCLDRLNNNKLVFRKIGQASDVESDDEEDNDNVEGGLSNATYNTKLRSIFMRLDDAMNGTVSDDDTSRSKTYPSQRIIRHMFINFMYGQKYDDINQRLSESQKKWLAFQMGHEKETQQLYLRDFDLKEHPELKEKEGYLYRREWTDPPEVSKRLTDYYYEWLGFPPSTTELGIPSITAIHGEYAKYDNEFSPKLRDTPKSGEGNKAVFLTLAEALEKFKTAKMEEDLEGDELSAENIQADEEAPEPIAGVKRPREEEKKKTSKKTKAKKQEVTPAKKQKTTAKPTVIKGTKSRPATKKK